MANKRMFSKQIIDSDAFLDMSPTAQLLYFHLVMRADDEGFVGNPKKIMREVGIQGDDFKVLAAKRFLLVFESGVVVIKHWLIHNTIRMDRFNETSYQDEKNLLDVKQNKAYTELATNGLPDGNHLEPQVKLSKVKLSKDNKDISAVPADAFNQFWNAYPKKELKKKTQEIWQRNKLDLHLEEILRFIEVAKNSDRWKKGFVKQPPVFLNGECWNDDLSSYQDKNTTNTKKIYVG
jgi:hypothetical protein